MTASHAHTAYLIERTHGGGGRRNDVVNEEKKCVLRPKVNSLPYKKVELADGEIGWNQVFLLVQITDARLWRLLHDYLFDEKQ